MMAAELAAAACDRAAPPPERASQPTHARAESPAPLAAAALADGTGMGVRWAAPGSAGIFYRRRSDGRLFELPRDWMDC